MGAIDDIKSASIMAKVALVCLLVANIFNGIAFTTTSWGVEYSVIVNTEERNPLAPIINTGLWRACTGTPASYSIWGTGSCPTSDFTGSAADWVATVQAMACFGFAGIIGAFILVLVFVLKSKNKDHAFAAAIICLVTGVLYLIGVIIFGVIFTKYPVIIPPSLTRRNASWSFALAIISIVLEIVSGVLLIIDAIKGGSSTSPA